MALSDPIAAYNAANNFDAVLVQQFLESEGIECYISEDNSLVGQWMGGMLPEIHKPQVWIDRPDSARVAELLTEFEARRRQWQHADGRSADADAEVEVTCEQCGGRSLFPEARRGTTQDCPQCGAAVDVGEVDWPYGDDWDVADAADHAAD